MVSATVLFGLIAPFPDVAHAHDPTSNPTGHKETPVEAVPDQPSITSIIPALGDFKKDLLDRGINFQLSYPLGGVKQGATYGSVLYMAVDADLAKLAGLPGATFRVNASKSKAPIFQPTIFSIIRRSAVLRRGQRCGFSSFGPNRSFSPTWRRSASAN